MLILYLSSVVLFYYYYYYYLHYVSVRFDALVPSSMLSYTCLFTYVAKYVIALYIQL